jgi:hypothetical protein
MILLIQPFPSILNIKIFQSRSCQTGSWCKFQKRKPDSDEEEKEEEEREEDKEEVAAALDSDDVSCEQVDTYAYDHAKQGLETQIASDNHDNPVSKVIDGCESAKSVLDDIEKDGNDVTGQKKLWVEVCKLKINFHMIILMRMQMINPNTN